MSRRSLVIACVAVLTAVTWCYWPVSEHQFVDFDDPQYVTANVRVLSGLTSANVVWALTTFHFSNWHPLTWLSHMLDIELHGDRAGGHLMTNLALHAANCILLLLGLRRMTGSTWRSALVAALFGLHPLRVESVAWVSERKDLLCLFFGFLAIWSYAVYATRGGAWRYAATLGLFALGLMAKPMLVTLPFVLLLLDWWPLGRLGVPKDGLAGRKIAPSVGRLVLEKAPMMALAACSSVLTILAQSSGGSVKSIESVPIEARLANAVVSCVQYLRQTLWPADLCVFYPHPGAVDFSTAAGAFAILVAISAGVLLVWRRQPHLLVGWLWFLGTLVPVIGIIQVGEQARADRYTAFPHIGLFIMAAWSLPTVRPGLLRSASVAACLAPLLILAGLTRAQVNRWHNTRTLFEHAVSVTRRNYLAHYALGHWHLEQGNLDAAATHLLVSLEVKARQPDALNDLGLIMAARSRWSEAMGYFESAIAIQPNYAEAHHNLADVLARLGRLAEAEAAYRIALKQTPESHETHYNLALLLLRINRRAEAAEHLREVLRLRPDIDRARTKLDEIESSGLIEE